MAGDDFDIRRYLDGVGAGLAGSANVIMQLALAPVGYGVVESAVESGQATRHPVKRARTTFTYLAVAMLGNDDARVGLLPRGLEQIAAAGLAPIGDVKRKRLSEGLRARVPPGHQVLAQRPGTPP
ncbi:MAG: oxygenase MpaB family protein [Jatrophihabitans sp.]